MGHSSTLPLENTMALPGYQEFMLPLLKIAADGREHTIDETIELVAATMKISEEDKRTLLPGRTQTRLYSRVTWALTYLTKSLLLEKPSRGRYRITGRGHEVLGKHPLRIDNTVLAQFPEFRAFRARRPTDRSEPNEREDTSSLALNASATPDEQLEAASRALREALADDLLQRVRGSSPAFFEDLVVDLLVRMGYGGSHADAASVVGRSGDGGIDGVIKEDRLGLDMVYVQAKRWENPVGPDQIRQFVGSLGERKAHKGVFITSGTFTNGARDAAEKANAKVVLIDGEALADFMIDHDVGVAASKTYIVKRMDSDYFEDA